MSNEKAEIAYQVNNHEMGDVTPVNEETDLTTLVGENDKFRALVQAKFQSEFGNITWGDVRLSTKDEFLDEYGSNNAAARSLLRKWIADYGLEDGFKAPPQDTEVHTAGDLTQQKFIEGICQQPTLEATNGVHYVDIVPKDYEFNALGEKGDRSGGIWPGPVVVRPEYYAIYEEIKYRQKYEDGFFHCVTGTPGIGKSFFAPILARFIMNDDNDAIIAYWRANSLYIFSKASLVGIPGLPPDEIVGGEGAAFQELQVFGENQRTVLEKICIDRSSASARGRLYILRDPPRLARDDKAGDMNELQGAKMRVVLASNGSPIIAELKSKGVAHFYYVQPWPMEHIEAAFSARLIGGASGETGGQLVSSHVVGISAARVGAAGERKADYDQVRAVYENAAAAISSRAGDATALSVEENKRLEELRHRFAQSGGNLRLLLFSDDKYKEAVDGMAGKLSIFFSDHVSKIPKAPSFVDPERFYGTILHVVPTELPTEGSPLGLVHATMKWASPYVENLAIIQVLQDAHEFADRFATVLGGSGSQGTYTGVFEGQCHRDLASGNPIKRKLKVLVPPGVPRPTAPELNWQRKNVHHFCTQNAIGRLKGIGVGTYCKPFVCNFPTADSFALIKKEDFYGKCKCTGADNMVVAFQMTISDSQSSDPKPSHIVRSQDEVNILKAVQHELGGGKSIWSGKEDNSVRDKAIEDGKKHVDLLALVFLVPDNCVEGMRYMKPQTTAYYPRKNNASGIDPCQYVMSLDQGWDMTVKGCVESQRKKQRNE